MNKYIRKKNSLTVESQIINIERMIELEIHYLATSIINLLQARIINGC